MTQSEKRKASRLHSFRSSFHRFHANFTEQASFTIECALPNVQKKKSHRATLARRFYPSSPTFRANSRVTFANGYSFGRVPEKSPLDLASGGSL